MKVCHVWDSEYPWDVRAEKVSFSLSDSGTDVHLVARNRQGRSLVERLPEATVHRMAPLPRPVHHLSGVSMFPAFFNPRWRRAISDVVRREECDVLLCRDIPLGPTCILVAQEFGIPVVLDMAENYPAMVQAVWDHGRQGPFDFLVRNPAVVRRVEEWVLARVDHVIVVVEESADRIEGLGVPRDRITVSMNTPLRRRIPDAANVVRERAPLEVAYLGLMEAPRGVQVALSGLKILLEAGYDARLTLIGDGRDRQALETRAAELELGDAVRFLGRLPYDEALKKLREADVGLIPHHANESWNSTIPNKLFDYMSLGLPVLTSNARPAARIVEEVGAGASYVHSDPEDLARAAKALWPVEVRQAAAASGRQAVVDRYNWDLDGERVVSAIEQVVGRA